MAYFTSLWQARTIEKYRLEYENEKLNSLLISNTEIPRKTMMQRWRIYGHYTKRRMTGRLKKCFPDGSSVSNLYYYIKTDQTFPNFVLKSIIGFLGGIVLTYLCFMFFVFQLSISLIHATFMSSIIGVLLTLGLAFSFRIRCLVFLLIPQFFSRVGRYTLMCYALVLILTGPATNTLKNSEVLSESMACSQEQIKSSARQITDSMKTPFNSMKDSIKIMVDKIKGVASELNDFVSKIGILATSIGDEIQSSLNWLTSVVNICNSKLGSPYDYCMKAVSRGLENCKKTVRSDLAWICRSPSAKSACLSVKTYDSICVVADYATTSFAATLKRKLKTFTTRISEESFIDIEMHHSHSFSSNASVTANQVAAGIVTEMRNRADPLLTWLSWSSCVTSLFLLLIIFRAKYYQQMYETRSRFDNRYVTKELRELDLKRYQEGRETVLPLNRREQAKYISVTSYRLIATEKVYLTRSIVFMTITTFKLLIHMVADYSLYWVLMTIRYHGRFQSQIPPGSSDAGVYISGTGFVKRMIQSLFDSMTIPLLFEIPSPVTCLPNPYPPDFKRYMQIAVLITLLWFFALFEPYGLRLRHVIMGHYRPERAKSRAMWLYNHILRTRGSTPNEPHCLLCNTFEDIKDGDTKLKSCETLRCPGIYCLSCFSDIGKLCTICLSPADYGDMSDVSLENGSCDESTDDEKDNINFKLLNNDKNDNDNERTKLIKKSSDARYNNIQKRNKGGGQYEACYTLTNDKSYKYRPTVKMKRDTTKCNGNIKTRECFMHKIYQNRDKMNKPFRKALKSEYSKLRFKFKNLHKYKKKYETQSRETGNRRNFYRLFATFLQYSALLKFSPSVYNIQTSKKSVKVYKTIPTNKKKVKVHKTKRTTKFSTDLEKKCKHFKRCNKIINKNVSRRPLLNLLYARRSKSSNPKTIGYSLNTNNLNNVKDNSGNKQHNNVSKIKKKRKNKKSNDKVPGKGKIVAEEKQCCRRVKKIGNLCSTCFFIMKRQVTPSKELSQTFKKKNYPDSINKSNFKRRKKERKDDNDKSIRATIESENTRNYRISTYLYDNCWMKGKPSKDSKEEGLKKEKALYDLADLRMEAVQQQAKEIKLLKIIKKFQFKRSVKCCCISDNDDSSENRKHIPQATTTTIQEEKCFQPLTCSPKKVYCNDIRSSHSNLMTKNKKKTFKTIHKLSSKKKPSQDIADPNVSRRLNLYSSLGISDFRDDNVCDKKLSCCKCVHAEKISSPSFENSPTIKSSRGIKSEFSRLSTSLKSLKIKDIYLGISERFLHLRIKKPLPVIRELYTRLLEVSKKERSKDKEKEKLTEEKSIEVLPKVETRSCQYINVEPHVKKEDQTMIRELFTHLLEGSKKQRSMDKEKEKLTEEKGIGVLPKVETRSCQYINVEPHVKKEDQTTQIPKRKKTKTYTVTPNPLRDVETEVKKYTCTCATQCCVKDKESAESCTSMITKILDETRTIYKNSSLSVSGGSGSVISFSDETKTDTTICSRVEINYEENHKKKTKRKVHVVTKANQSTATEKANLCDVSTITNDWWSPIVDRKPRKDILCREIKRSRRQKTNHDRSVSTDGKIVTFMSRAQIIPTDTRDILSPSRYLLESQKYYNELFTSERFSPRVYPVLFNKKSKYRGKNISSRDSMSSIRKDYRARSGCKKRLDKRVSSSFKTRIGKTRSDESNLKY